MGSSGATNTAAMIFGGDPLPTRDNAETYDGSSWTEGANLNSGRGFLGGTGTSTAALAIGGWIGPGSSAPTNSKLHEYWNGTSWTELADQNTARAEGGSCGTSTAALWIGGKVFPNTKQDIVEEWNGTSWTEVADLVEVSHLHSPASQGTVTAALIAGGADQGGTKQSETESWDGSSWTEVADLNANKQQAIGAGTQTCLLYTSPSPRD